MAQEIQAGVAYKVVKIGAYLEEKLNDLAQHGWEVVAAADKVVILERR